MTWKEFKDEIDYQLKQKGISEDTEIDYIDVTNPVKSHDMKKPEVYFEYKITIHQ